MRNKTAGRAASPPDAVTKATVVLRTAEPQRAQPARVSWSMPRETAFARILQSALDQIQGNTEAVREGDDPEGVHQMRVGLRRFRAGLGMFAPELSTGAADEVRAALGGLLDVLGPARDWDVCVEERIRPAEASVGDEPAFRILAAAARRERTKARNRVRRHVASAEHAAVMARLAAWIQERGWRAGMERGEIQAFREPVGTLARAKLDRGHRRIRRAGENLDSGDDAAWHRLRIAVKRQRYLLEAFRSGCPAKREARYADALVALQDRLGLVQDVAVADRLLTGLAARRGEAARAFVSGLRVGWAREQEDAQRWVQEGWERFVDGERPWHERK